MGNRCSPHDSETDDSTSEGSDSEASSVHTLLSLGPALSKQEVARSCSIRSLISRALAPVYLNVYEVGHARAIEKLNRMTQDVLKQGGIFHAGIEVFEREWSFGATKRSTSGVFHCEPCACQLHTYRESLYLGDCGKTEEEVRQIIRGLKPEWNGRNYDRLHRNCIHFSEEFSGRLGVGPVPDWVHHMEDVGAKLDDKMKAAIHKLHIVEDRLLSRRSLGDPEAGRSG
mmetsp:Transcript_24906/g.71461  ORF Transcript_24906/g.71461 Transcript_24906/m.71461 type:complete len:228 (+) Transcript_24906:57-740(+)